MIGEWHVFFVVVRFSVSAPASLRLKLSIVLVLGTNPNPKTFFFPDDIILITCQIGV